MSEKSMVTTTMSWQRWSSFI